MNSHHFLCFFIIFLVFILLCFLIPKSSKSPKLPPGPWKLPFIGNLHQLTGALPHHKLRDLAEIHGPIMHLKLGQLSTIVISSPQAAEQVMKDYDINFADRPHILAVRIMSYNTSDFVFAPYGGYWKRVRKICIQDLLSFKRVQSFQKIRQEELQNLVDSISRSSSHGLEINFTEKLGFMITDFTSRAAFGIRCKHKDKFMMIVKEASNLASGFVLSDLYPSLKFLSSISRVKPRLEKLHCQVDQILDNIIDEHIEKNRNSITNGREKSTEEDLVDSLLKLQETVDDIDFPITSDNVKAIILDMFSAGTESSSATIEWAMAEMMRNSRVLKRAQEEVRSILKQKTKIQDSDIEHLHYLKLVIKETLRLHPPAPLLLPRQSRKACKINGYDIPSKTRVIINSLAIGRDPNRWIKAECFQPKRFEDSCVDFKGTNFEFIPFGAGRRMCPGMAFGIANIELPLARLLYHFDWKLLDGIEPEKPNMEETFGVTMARKKSLYLIPSIRF